MSHSSHSDPEKHLEEKGQVSHLQVEHTTAANIGNAKTVNVHNAAFAAATAEPLSPWSKESLFLFWCMFVSFLCSCANGYDGSLMTGINGMPFYNKMIGSDRLSSGTSLVFSMYTVGGILGPWFAGPVCDRWGRRMGMFSGGLLICIGTAVIASSHAHPQFIGGRFVLGFGISFMTTAAPSYCVEICPPQWRGRMTGFYNCGWFGGSIPAAGVTLGTQGILSDWSWRIPLIIQAVPSVIVMLSVWFLPESPRWLMANGYDDKARDFLITYHGAGNPTHPMVELEWIEFKENIALDGSDKRWYDYSELFNSSSARWRSLMVILMGVFGQFSGNGLGYFNTEIYASLGYDQYHQFTLNLANSFTSATGAGFGVALADKMPRRKVLVWGTFASAVMLAGNGALSYRWAHQGANKNLAIGQAGVFFYFLFNIIYSFTYTPLQALYPVECLQTTARAKGMAMYAVIVGLVGFINTYAGPIALKNIKYNYIFIFVAWDCVEAVLWYLLGVETVGRTLEELEEIFGSPNPVATSKQTRTVAIRAGGQVAIVD